MKVEVKMKRSVNLMECFEEKFIHKERDRCLFLSIKSVVFFEQVKKSLFSCDLYLNLD